MEISSLTFFLTEECNFDCTYCYQKKGNRYLDLSTAEKALLFFLPYLKTKSYINFYGGEPLLAFPMMAKAIDFIEADSNAKEKHFRYSLSTNGSLLDEKKLAFLDKHNFSLLLSFDGLAQETHRKKDSFFPTVAILKKISKYPDIDFEINSVFTPKTIDLLSESVQFITEMGVPNVSYALSQTSDWDHSSLIRYEQQLESLKDSLLCFHRQKGFIPSVNFRSDPRRGVFTCYAARDRMAIDADGKLWGCHLFADFYKGKEDSEDYAKFCFGDLDYYIKHHEEILLKTAANYENLRMDQFYTGHSRCADCPELKECRVCPLDNMIQGLNFREIPDWVCEQKRMTRGIKKEFWKQLGDPLPADHPVNHG